MNFNEFGVDRIFLAPLDGDVNDTVDKFDRKTVAMFAIGIWRGMAQSRNGIRRARLRLMGRLRKFRSGFTARRQIGATCFGQL